MKTHRAKRPVRANSVEVRRRRVIIIIMLKHQAIHLGMLQQNVVKEIYLRASIRFHLQFHWLISVHSPRARLRFLSLSGFVYCIKGKQN